MMFLTKVTQFLNRHHRSTDIRGMQTDQKPCLGTKKCLCLFYKKRPVFTAGDAVKSYPVPGELHKWTHDGIVFHGGDKHMITGL